MPDRHPNRKGWGKRNSLPLPPNMAPPGSKAPPKLERPLLALESLIRAGLLRKQGCLWDFSIHQQQHRKPESQAHRSPGDAGDAGAQRSLWAHLPPPSRAPERHVDSPAYPVYHGFPWPHPRARLYNGSEAEPLPA